MLGRGSEQPAYGHRLHMGTGLLTCPPVRGVKTEFSHWLLSKLVVSLSYLTILVVLFLANGLTRTLHKTLKTYPSCDLETLGLGALFPLCPLREGSPSLLMTGV